MKTNLGKVAITPKGVWNATTAYAALDTVNFGGGSWLAKRGNIAVTPTEGDDWMQLSAKGADAEVTKDSIVGALGFTPQEAEDKYELINSIITTEAIKEVVFTTDSSGNSFRLKHAVLIFKSSSEQTTAVDGSLYFRTPNDTNLASGWFAEVFTGHKGLSYFWCNFFGSRVQGFFEAFNAYNTTTESTNISMKRVSSVVIGKTVVSCSAGIPVGATISLYGIRT